MMRTQTVLLALPQTEQLRELVDDVVTAATRAAKSDPGDRSDIARYERLCSALESLAWRAAANTQTLTLAVAPTGAGLPLAAADISDPLGKPLAERLPSSEAAVVRSWLAEDCVAVALTVPFGVGQTTQVQANQSAPEPAEPWRATNGEEGSRAVEARFRAQVEAALAVEPAGTRQAVDPSGVHNRVLTQVLHQYVRGRASTRVDASIAYRDGSAAANPFPMHCLPLSSPPATAAVDLHLSLLSMRHTDMDPVTDGAWLRNAEVSRPRPAAQTDDYVYATSLEQLHALTEGGRRTARLHVYQTGLDAAIVGFYRSVTVHLLKHPGTLIVVPMFASVRHGDQLDDGTCFRPGRPWCTEGLQ
jgi:hypothetical protein